MTTLRGAISFWSDRGFGFIARDDGEADVFVHSTTLPSGFERLHKNQKVEFDIERGRNGKLRATNVTLA